MPNKTIYVKDADVEMFEKAEALGGENLSATIAEALRRFVEVEEAKADGFEEKEIEVGIFAAHGSKDTKKVKFIGKYIAGAEVLSGTTNDRRDRGTDYTLYLTKKGKYLLYRQYWSCWQDEDGDASFQIFDSLADMAESAPGSLLQDAGEALGTDTAEYLDV